MKYFKLNPNPSYRDVFDINGYFKDAVNTKLSLDEVENIVVGQNQPNVLRIVFSNKTSPNITYTISKRQIIITVNGNSSNKKVSKQEIKNEPKQTSSQNKTNSKQNSQITTKATTPTKVATPKNSINKTIVIDAGHGGDDVGAVGPNKRYEKVINLNVAKYLESILKQRGYKVYLTRSTDVFIKVMDRTVLANEKNADLFISIHTNSMPKEKANSTSGIETFFLSPARSERAKKVAALENKDDIREMNESSKSAFLESLNRPRITASHKFAIDVQSGLLQAARTKYKDVNDSGVKEGPFWVLVGAQMPSILIEVGFISHPEESRRLYEKDYQQLLANGIANGVDSYFSKNP
ncbi:N-acetylmuramoyl-L-alanine amidase family protein [Aliarcobacter butzleri]|uniref:N-acetylmuramoyl-L-alanine amidase family protein n=1 Tax=Aliarcobacter butzleri TaxID=28197 RepID=UPI003AFB0BEA